MPKNEKHVIGDAAEGNRLDRALHDFLPETGLRHRRRLCDTGRVLVDGMTRKPSYKVRPGQEVEIVSSGDAVSPKSLGVKLIAKDAHFISVSKPGGVHSAAIAGRDVPSVEAVLGQIAPGDDPILLNRLDNMTSGLLLVGLGEEARALYQKYESQGRIMKFYLAKIAGRLDGTVIVRNRLDTDDRKKTRVLDTDAMDDSRWTFVTSLSHDHQQNTTLVRCMILKGARHQIRAHLASTGHPIIGDPLYGEGEGSQLFLHHYRVELPGFCAEITPIF